MSGVAFDISVTPLRASRQMTMDANPSTTVFRRPIRRPMNPPGSAPISAPPAHAMNPMVTSSRDTPKRSVP